MCEEMGAGRAHPPPRAGLHVRFQAKGVGSKMLKRLRAPSPLQLSPPLPFSIYLPLSFYSVSYTHLTLPTILLV
eukprot:8648738-Pyramimonas_sp.AAC.1